MKKITYIIVLIGLITLVSALNDNSNPEATIDFSYPKSVKLSQLSYINSSNFWDNLNTPADILGSLINNDLGWITSYTDTNASTACSGSQYLAGNGNCLTPIITETDSLAYNGSLRGIDNNTFTDLNVTGNSTFQNITVECVFFESGGSWCSA